MNRMTPFRKPGFLSIVAAGCVVTAPAVLAQAIEFEEARVYLELNDTDGDLGIHGLIDGDAWKYLTITDPAGRQLMRLSGRSRLRLHGLTEIFFESAEPTFDEVRPDRFFLRFPEGEYVIDGITTDGTPLQSTVDLSHTLAGPAENVQVNGMAAAEDCDAILPVVAEPVTIAWDAVTMSHPDLGNTGEAVTVEQYELVTEIEQPGQVPELLVTSFILPPTVTSFELPTDFTDLAGDQMKFEIVTRLDNGNQTAVESCFEIGNP